MFDNLQTYFERLSKKQLFLLILLAAGGIALLISLIANSTILGSSNRGTVRIAVPAPLDGPDALIGAQIMKGAKLFARQFNDAGGMDGHLLEIVPFSEGADTDSASRTAMTIAQSDVSAVVGYWSAAAAAAAAPSYKSAGLPFLSLAGRLPGRESEGGSFSMNADETQEIRFLANYVRNIVGEKIVSIVHSSSPHSTALATAFDEVLQRFGTKVIYRWSFDADPTSQDGEFATIAADVDAKKAVGPILVLADDARSSARAIAVLRAKELRNPVIGGRVLATKAFRDHFVTAWREIGSDHGTAEAAINGVMLATPFLFDTSGEMAQSFRSAFISTEGESPDWVAAQAFDALRLAVGPLQSHRVDVMPPSVELAKSIQERLSSMDRPSTAFPALSGPLHFDASGRAVTFPLIGQYNGLDLISAMTQLTPIRDEGVVDYLQEIVAQRALYVNDRFMYKTNVVYTGVRVDKVSAFDPAANAATIEAMVWFRWRGALEPQDVVFSNAVEPIKLDAPERESKDGEVSYRAYRVKGRFFLNYSNAQRSYGTHLVGMTFHHRLLGRNNLMYVNDVLGMGLSGEKTFVDQMGQQGIAAASVDGGGIENATLVDKALGVFSGGAVSGDPLTEFMKQSRVLASLSVWIIDRAWVSQETVTQGTEGDPVFVGFGRPSPAFSLVDMGMILKPDTITARDFIPRDWFVYIAIFAAIGSILAALLDRKDRGQFWRMQTLGLRIACWPALLVASGNLALDYALKNFTTSITDSVVLGFNILWWIVPARLVVIALERFLWVPLENRSGRKIPGVIRNFSAASVYLFTTFGVIAFVMDKPITSLLATGGLTAMIIGLAVQANIANVFSGIVLNLEKPFSVGDWIRVDRTIGQVIDVTWRTTKLQAKEGIVVSIPNRKVSESNVENLSRIRALEVETDIFVDWRHNPDEVLPLIRECLETNEHLFTEEGDAAKVTYRGVQCMNGHWVARYKVSFFVKMMPKRGKALQDLWLKVWPKFMERGIGWVDFNPGDEIGTPRPQLLAAVGPNE